MEMYIRLDWHEFIGTEFKGETVIGVFSPKFKDTKIVVRNNNSYGENDHGMEVTIYAAKGDNEVFLFCDYLPWDVDVRDAEFNGIVGDFWS